MNYINLLERYRELWSNRNLSATNQDSAKEVLEETIRKDINDEMTHPRVRKDPSIKFYWAIKRIEESDMDMHFKMALIQFYIDAMENITH